MTATSLLVAFPHATLADFGAASGDVSPLHCDDEYASRTDFGRAIIHGSLTLLAMAARTPLGAAPAPLAMDAVYRHAVMPGLPYSIEADARDDGWRLELLEGDGTSVTSANLRTVVAIEAPASPQTRLGPMRVEPATPSAENLAEGLTAHGEYRPGVERLLVLAREYSDGGEVSLALAAGLGWVSYLAGMELPGRHSMCRRVSLAIHGPARAGEGFESSGRVERFDSRTSLLRVSGLLSQAGAAVATCTLGVHWRGEGE